MKISFQQKILFLACFLFGWSSTAHAQISIKNLGTSRTGYSNAYGTRQGLACYPAQNLVGWIHRSSPINNTIKMDISMNGGNTWVVDKITSWGVTPGGRLPKMTFFNPAGNTNPSNVWATGIIPIVSNTARNSYGTTVVSVATAGGTVLNIDTPLRSRQDTLRQVGSSVVSLSDRILLLDKNGSIGVGNADFTDSLTLTTLVPSGNRFTYFTRFLPFPMTAAVTLDRPGLPDVTMAFNESGSKGYIVGLGHQSYSGADTGVTYLPIVMSSTDGGDTWSSPTQLSISALVRTALGVTWNPTCGWELSATVDQNGNLHILTSVSRSLYSFDTLASGASNMAMVDIVTDGSAVLSVKKLGNPNSYRGLIGLSTTGQLTSDLRPCASRNLNGDKLFFNWFETQSTLSATNNKPDWWMAAYDVVSNNYTTAKNITAGTVAEGKVIFGSAASQVFSTSLPNGTIDFEIPVTYTALGAAGSLADSVFHKYIQGGKINSSTFAGGNYVYTLGDTFFCSGDSVSLFTTSTTGNQWFRNGVAIPGATQATLVATTGGTYTNVSAGNTSNALKLNEIKRPATPVLSPALPSLRSLCPGDSILLSTPWRADTLLQWFNQGILLSGIPTGGQINIKNEGVFTARASFQGCYSSFSNAVTVRLAPAIRSSFSVSDSVQCLIGNSFTFTQTSTIDSGSLQWKWELGNGDTSTQTVVRKTYAQPGIYTVKCSIISTDGCRDSLQIPVSVVAQDTAKFTVSKSMPLAFGDSVQLISSAASGNQWTRFKSSWLGKNSNSIWVKTPGLYGLMVEKNGCVDSAASIQITMDDPKIYFSYQGKLVNSNNKTWPNKTVQLRCSVMNDTTVEYQETQTVKTDTFGLFSVLLGSGQPSSAGLSKISKINWGNLQARTLKVEVDTSNSGVYYQVGTSALVSVPMAMYAVQSASDAEKIQGIFNSTGDIISGEHFGVQRIGNQRHEISFYQSFQNPPVIFLELIGAGNFSKKVISINSQKALIEITGNPSEVHFSVLGN